MAHGKWDAGMQFGLFSMNSGPCVDPEVAVRIARLAEDAGFDSLWAGEHVVLPDPRVPPSPMDPGDPILDPLVALTFLAAHTRRVLLGTGIIILPQRNPLVLAKEIASLQALSAGRLLFGIGVGYLEPEFRALGIPFDEKGPRTDEYLAAMRAIWSADQPAYQGRFVAFSGVQAYPKPGELPVVVGGHSPGAYRRAVEQGQGWYGFGLNPDATAACMADVRAALARHDRPAHLGELEISVTPRGPINAETVARYADLGVHRLIVQPHYSLNAEQVAEYVTQIGETLIG
jgi:probable F420-dependent oxidoreductase